jgi:hypothetical protein
MRKPIRAMVDRYYKKSGIKIPVDVQFTKIKATAKLVTKYNPKTKQYIKNTIKIDDQHYKTLAKVDIKNAKIYLQRTVAHELGHLKRVQDNWEDVRGSYIRGIVDEKEENFADAYSKKLTGINDTRFNTAMKILQKKADQTSHERALAQRVKWEKNKPAREARCKKKEAGIKAKYAKYFNK